MQLESIQLFIGVHNAGGFAEYARRLNVHPSVVSRAIATLEKELGFRLFERTTRRFALTEAGRLFHAQMTPLLEEFNSAVNQVRDISAVPNGWLRATASIAFGSEVLVPLLPSFRERYPRVRLELVLNDEPLDLASERLDLAIRLGPPPEFEGVRTKLFPVRHRVCVSPKYLANHAPLTSPADLSDHDCVRFPLKGFLRQWRFRAADGALTEVAIAGSVIVSNALALKHCLMNGMGPGLLADWMISRELACGALVDPFPHYVVTATEFDTAAWLLYPNRTYLPAKVRVFIDHLREHAGSQARIDV